MPDSMKKARFE